MPYVVHWKDGTSSEMDDKQFENMPHEMESEIGKVEQSAPAGFTDTIKSSPMSVGELEQFYKENPDLREDILKYAPGVPSVQALQPEDTKLPFESGLPGEYSLTYDDVRKGLSALASPVIGGWNMMTGKYGNIGNPDQLPYTQLVGNAYTKGARGEGVPGLASNPMNLTLPFTGLAELAMAGEFGPTIGALATKSPALASGLAGAVEGGGLTALQSALDPNLEQSAGATGLGAGIGGALGFGGGLLRKAANESFPGMGVLNKRLDRSGGEQYTIPELESFRRDAAKEGLIPVSGLNRMENLEDSYRRKASELYENALDQVEPKANPEVLQIQRDLRATRDAMASQGEKDAFMRRLATGMDRSISARSGTPEAINLDNARILDGIRKQLSDDLFLANKTRRLNLKETEMNSYVDDIIERLRTRAADAPGGTADLASYTLTPRDVMNTKQILNEDIYNTTLGEVKSRQRTMAKAMHSSVDKMFDDYRTVSGKTFKEELGEGSSLYRKASRLEDLLKEGKYRGGSYKIGEAIPGVAKYVKFDPMYGLNDIFWRAGKNTPTLARGINALLTNKTAEK